MAIVTLTKENFFDEAVNTDKVVLLDFWAPWCAPCRMLTPILEEVDAEVDIVKICRINVDEQKELADEFNVTSIPLLVLMEFGEIRDTTVGFQSKEDIIGFIDE